MGNYFFLVINTVDEFYAKINYIATTLADAEAHLMKFADFYAENGTGLIKTVDNYNQTINIIRYVNGKPVPKAKIIE